MKIFVATDIKITLSNGKIYVPEKYSKILRRYFNAFGPIVVCSRAENTDTVPPVFEDITDIVDSLVPVPSLMKLLVNGCNSQIRSAMASCDLVIGRCPSIAAYKASDCARKLSKPYFAELMGCAWDAYWNHGLSGKLMAPYMYLKMKSVVKHADYALYVTSRFLQNRYPCKNQSVAASNVFLNNVSDDILNQRLSHIDQADPHRVTLITTAAVNVRYKGQEYVIKAISELEKRGYHAEYWLIGEGDYSYLASVAQKCGVSDRVKFLGRMSLEDVLHTIDTADIYIQPSLQEGLPRSVIEAMSRGCPCIGARTAGIPELLEDKYVVDRKSVSDIVDVVVEYIQSDVQDKKNTAVRNFNEAKGYETTLLNARRNAYFETVRNEIGE